MRSIATVVKASMMVSGLSGLLAAADAGVWTLGPMEDGRTPGALNSTVAWAGPLTWPGTTRANSSSRLCGFSTMPTTRRAVPPWCQTPPIVSLRVDATPLVTAT
jgi:hypothetical protein